MEQERGQFSSKVGFILAAAGSAVGLGNLVAFPVMASKDGGAAFLIIYLFFIALILSSKFLISKDFTGFNINKIKIIKATAVQNLASEMI